MDENMITIKFEKQDGSTFDLTFAPTDTPIASKWASKLSSLKRNDVRFDAYGISSLKVIVAALNASIKTINAWKPDTITTKVTTTTTIEVLNQLHDIFLTLAGDATVDEADDIIQAVVALNTNIHAFEAAQSGSFPSVTLSFNESENTSDLFTDEDLRLTTFAYEFGTVYANYSTLGKTLSSLARNNDQHVETFALYDRFDADMSITFYDNPLEFVQKRTEKCEAYFAEHQKFFNDLGFQTYDDPRLLAGYIPVAKLVSDLTHEEIVALISEAVKVVEVSENV